MRMARQVRGVLNKVLGWANVGLFACMVAVGTYQILVRYLFNRPSTVSEELMTYAFAWMSLLAASCVFGMREHMRMGFFVDRFSEKAKRRLDVGIEALNILFAAVILVYGGVRITALTMSQRTASLGIPMGYLYGILPVCGTFIMIYGICNLAELFDRKEEG